MACEHWTAIHEQAATRTPGLPSREQTSHSVPPCLHSSENKYVCVSCIFHLALHVAVVVRYAITVVSKWIIPAASADPCVKLVRFFLTLPPPPPPPPPPPHTHSPLPPPPHCYCLIHIILVVSKPGQEPSISYGIDTLEENMNLLDPIFSKMSHRKRKAYFVKRYVIELHFIRKHSGLIVPYTSLILF